MMSPCYTHDIYTYPTKWGGRDNDGEAVNGMVFPQHVQTHITNGKKTSINITCGEYYENHSRQAI
jgi:hypothetical protein